MLPALLHARGAALPHIWCGVSVEDRRVWEHIRHLAMAPAAVRFLSLEPLLEDLATIDLGGIAGSSSMVKAAPMPVR